ncbi:membrane-spanning 4-domains subfamily A member 4A-like isoform 2-T3 [Anomaloglossus baeobatrachus]
MSSNARVESLVILPHVSPENNQPTDSQEEQSKYVPAEMPKRFLKFFQGEPEVLGVTQLIIGLNHIFFGIIFIVITEKAHLYIVSIIYYTGVLVWSGIMHVISGSLSVTASYKPSFKMTLYQGIGATLLLLTALEFCIALSTSIFGCKAACSTSYSEVAVVVYHASLNDPKTMSSVIKTC